MSISGNCYVIGVFGGKGGVGKSTYAASLALALVTEMKAPTLLLDADQDSCGDQNILLGIRQPKTMDELTRYTGALNRNTLPQVVNPHPAGLHYLAAVKNLTDPFSISESAMLQKLQALSQTYQFIVADLGHNFGDFQNALIQEATALLCVTQPDIISVSQSLRTVQQLQTSMVPAETIKVVVNKSGANSLPPVAIQNTLKCEILGVLPQDDVSAQLALQKSSPIVLSAPRSPLAGEIIQTSRKLTGGMLQKLAQTQRQRPQAAPPKSLSRGEVDPKTALKITAHNLLIKEMNLKNEDITKAKNDEGKQEKLRQDVQLHISRIIDKVSPGMPALDRKQVIKEVLDEALGLGPLEELLADPAVSEIMVNGFDRIFYEKSGKILLSKIKFTSNLQLRNVIERIVTPLGRRIDEKTPYVDARLPDGSRVNAVIEPLSIDGPALTIRKFREDAFGMAEYVKYNSASTQMMSFLKLCVENGLNVVISGGTGSGKTTLLNCISSFIPATERIITVEDAAELQLKQEHVVRLETRPANMEGSGAITIRDLVRNSLRMRPDRIVVGECRDGAALDMLSAMNTGHDGSMTTVHSNSPRESISRLETLCLMAGMDLPVRAIREQIAGAVDLIIQISRLSDGTRKIISITEVQGMQGETITLQEVFCFKEKGFDKNRKIIGEFQATGLIPKFIERFERRGIIIPKDLFSNDKSSQQAQAPQAGRVPRRPLTPLKKAGGES